MEHQPFDGLLTIGQINIPVHNLETAVSFYRDALGMNYLFQVPNMAFFDCGGVRLLLGVPEDDALDHPSSIIYFTVSDIHSAADALRERGLEIAAEPRLVAQMPDHDLWMTLFRDSEGNTLALMSEIARQE
jgi:methylmalonyl-CoA/ethylmalonyl-CoA epimerase